MTDMFRAVLYLSLLFTVTVGEILPSILWNPSNPLFDLLGNSARNVMPSDQLPILCPTPYQYPVKMNNFYSRHRLFENLFLVDKAGFDGCNATMGQKILDCKDPVNIIQTTLVFQPASASGPSFKQGKEYYFINTASGLEDSLRNVVGGRCGAGKMKLKIYVCKGASDSKCKDGNNVVHGGWSDWSQCKDGLQTRSCDSPCQANGGIPCIGDSVRQCATKASQTNEGVLTDEGNSIKVIIVVLSCFVALLIIVIGVLVLLLRRKQNAVPETSSGDAPRANSPDQNTRNDSSLDQHTSAQRFYKELSPRPQADIQPYAASQHGKASHGYYNVSFSREETQLDKYEVPLPSGDTPTYEEIN